MNEQNKNMKLFSEETMWGDFSRYLGNEMDAGERAGFETWVAGNPSAAKELENARYIWKNSSVKEARLYDVNRGWEKISARMHRTPQSVKVSRTFVLRSALRIAASILFLMILAFFAQKLISRSGTITIAAQEKMITHPVILPDGSKVFLNAGSVLKYPKHFGQQSRNIELTGEAYFDVIHHPQLPFVVQTRTTRISVLGTSFNVFAYHDRDSVEVTVESGMVEMESKTDHTILRLAKGNTGVFYAGSNQFVHMPSDLNNVAWKTNIIVFNRASLEYVSHTLGRIFHKNIQLTGKKLLNCKLTGEFRDQDFDKILEAVRESLNLKLTRKGTLYILDGPGC